MRPALLMLISFTATAQTATWSEHVAPLLFQYCVSCHRPNEAGPFPLLSYEDAKKHATQIAEVTQRGYMPPWPPEPGHGEFVGSRRLSSAQVATLANWVRAGTPAGDPAKAPPTPKFTEGWQLGPPDAVLRMPQPYPLKAEPGDDFRNFVIPTYFRETRYVRAIELRPGNKRVVHHANIVVDRTQALRARNGLDGKPGFPGMDVVTEAGEEFVPDSHFLFWKPGTVSKPEPDDMAWRLDPGTDLVVNLHLQPSGKPEMIRAEIGLYFTPNPPTRLPMLVQLEHDGAIDIPPGSKQFCVEDHLRLPVAADVLAVYPHAHYLGKSIEAWAVRPDGTRIDLLLIRDWDMNWQASYTYRRPVSLPAGTTLAMRIGYDNTAANPRNPLQPPGRARAGNRSQDEMGHVWFQVLPQVTGRSDPRLLLQEAMMRRRLEKYPADFLAQFNLGSALVALDRNEEGIPYLERSVRLSPDNAAARNSYGAALVQAGQFDKAIDEFRQVLQKQPTYINSRYNLARALAAQGDAPGAMTELRALLAQEPDDGKANYLLAGILAGERRYSEAVPYFRKAAASNPTDADVQTNYGTVLALEDDLLGAVAAFENALRINPDHQEARANLLRAQAALKGKNQ
jgi:Flp pilus assembly protein TadD